jgi:nitroreductase
VEISIVCLAGLLSSLLLAVVVLLAVGVPSEEPDPRRSWRPLDELVRWVGEAED